MGVCLWKAVDIIKSSREIVDVPEKRAVHFKPGNELRERVNAEHEHEFLNVKVFRGK